MRWIKLGGERVSEERRLQEERARASQLRFKVEPKSPEDARQHAFGSDDGLSEFGGLPSVVSWLINTLK